MRLFETMQVGRCPVILSDDWLPPPFVDWEACSLRIPERQVTSLPEILRARCDEAAQLGLAARRAWEENFSPARRLATIARAAITATNSIGTWDRAATIHFAVFDKESARLANRGARKRVRTALQRRAVAGSHFFTTAHQHSELRRWMGVRVRMRRSV